MHDGERIKPRAQVVDDNAGAFGKPLQIGGLEMASKYRRHERV